ncbi:hypothetical protein V6Z88_009093 [Aspergillus fumigatus]|nr:hypothetical protein KXV75_006127 [Aspergillus fumigatus]
MTISYFGCGAISFPQFSSTTANEEGSQPWKMMQEIQNLFKPEMAAALEANAESNEIDEESLELELARLQFNPARPNIVNAEEQY